MPSTAATPPLPLSPVEEGLLAELLAGRRPGIGIEQITVELREPVDAARLERAFTGAVARHPALRSTFLWDGLPAPQRVVHAAPPVRLAETDLGSDTESAREAAAARLASGDRYRPFALDTLPLLRLRLIRLGPDRSRLVWTFPHLILDGRSFALVLREVFTAYDGGAVPEQPPGAAERRDLTPAARGVDAADAAFWSEYLDGCGSAARVRLGAAGHRDHAEPGYAERDLGAGMRAALEELARRAGVNLGTVIHAAAALVASRWAGGDEIVLGTVRAGRHPDAAPRDAVGCFINTVPLRVRIPADGTVDAWLAGIRDAQLAMRAHEHAPLAAIRRWGALPGSHPFDLVLVYDDADLATLAGARAGRSFALRERTGFPLTLSVAAHPTLRLALAYEPDAADPSTAGRFLAQLGTTLAAMASAGDTPPGALPLLPPDEEARVLDSFGSSGPAAAGTVADRIVAAAARDPERTAVIADAHRLTYAELAERAAALAARLADAGAGPGVPVGVCLGRTPDLVVALLGVLQTGAAYVPLDPEQPAARLTAMAADAGIELVVTDDSHAALVPAGTEAITVGGDARGARAAAPARRRLPAAERIAYVMFTSGSTGRPKGVLVTEANLLNFFDAMDEELAVAPGAVWLAVTTISFDISVLELLWTLSRGCTVVLASPGASRRQPPARRTRPELSLFFFASDAAGDDWSYDLLLEAARLADRGGLTAVWTPERHFHAFGGPYPNPAVAGAAVAAVTERVGIRAGSVTLPLHHPVRVAEEWSVVDRLSRGRAGVSFASGWHPNDFVLRPENYAGRRDVMRRDIDIVRRLWRGERVDFAGVDGAPVAVATLPRPVQPELPFWITAAGSPDTFRLAGELGAGVLTHLLGQTLDEVRAKLATYRGASVGPAAAGAPGAVLMVHTFVADSDEVAREAVRPALREYLRSSVELLAPFAAAFPAFHRRPGDGAAPVPDIASLAPDELEALLDFAVARFIDTSGLFGAPDTCLARLAQFADAGFDEVACLIDFGMPRTDVLATVARLASLRSRLAAAGPDDAGASIGALIRQHGVTHLQCTPTLLSALLDDEETRLGLGRLQALLVGGEALPAGLARRARAAVGGRVLNMYGPTETTVWSTIWEVDGESEGTVPIGRPLRNTGVFIVDRHLRPVPLGAAGELVIGGAGVTAGYLGRDDLTAERFVANHLAPRAGPRLYRTGDRVRRRDDGAIEFLGRLDNQVKVRGHRVEPGEIEAVLHAHPAVARAVVAADGGEPNGAAADPMLVAHLTLRSGARLERAELTAWLRERLPEYMIPPRIEVREELPVMVSGKLDRTAVAAPASAPARANGAGASGAGTAGPRDPVEQQLLAIWRRLLGRADFGTRDGFFDVGGHSLLAVRLVSEVHKAFGRRIPVGTLFHAATIEQLADTLRSDGWNATWEPLVPLQTGGARPPLFLVCWDDGFVFAYRALIPHLGSDQPVFGLQSPDLRGTSEPCASIPEMAARYIAIMRTVQPAGPYLLGGRCSGGVVAYEMARQLRASHDDVALLALLHSAPRGGGLPRPGTWEDHVRRFRHHRDELARRSMAERVHYVRRKTGVLLARTLHRGPGAAEGAPAPATVQEATKRALEAYVPPWYDGGAAVFVAIDGRPDGNDAPDLGWGRHMRGPVEVVEVPGGHFTAFQEPLVAQLGEALRMRIARSLAPAALVTR